MKKTYCELIILVVLVYNVTSQVSEMCIKLLSKSSPWCSVVTRKIHINQNYYFSIKKVLRLFF